MIEAENSVVAVDRWKLLFVSQRFRYLLDAGNSFTFGLVITLRGNFPH